ncbi:MAG TPA: PilC/PilY family type IV pilus protein [Steroidobacteraceae bacterium]|nr:PilC/PilY family type IV pilus protein [Steroidobacteraceae bacterium]
MNRNSLLVALASVAALVLPLAAPAQTTVTEDFTGTSTTNSWYFLNGACLTAGTAVGVEPSAGSAGQMPGCVAIATGGSGPIYYNEPLVGGWNGVAGNSQTLKDPTGHGALRFTNGSWCTSPSSTSPPGTCTAYSGGFNQNGAIISTTPFPTGQGIAVTFKTVSYRGNSLNGNNVGYSDGADGMSFYLMDASQLNTAILTGTPSGNGNGIGSWGGSLAYTCSNQNYPYNGLIGGYIGLGIDEYGNFLNGWKNTLTETGSVVDGNTYHDNTATGGFFQPGRIGLRGAGNVAWATLTGAYGASPANPPAPYYPAGLATSCTNGGGVYNASTGSCEICTTGTRYGYNSSTNQCEKCASGVTYNASNNTCESCPNGQTWDPTTMTCQSCSSGSYDAASNTCTSCPNGQTYDATTNTCNSCPNGQTYDASTQTCQSCSSGSYDSTSNTCSVCSSGSWDAAENACETCAGGTWTNSGGVGTCTGAGACSAGTWNGTNDKCEKCAAGYTYDASGSAPAGGECYKCPAGKAAYVAGDNGECCTTGATYNAGNNTCSSGSPSAATSAATSNGTAYTPTQSAGGAPTAASPTQGAPNPATVNPPQNPTASNPSTAHPDSYWAVQYTCQTGQLYYYTVGSTNSTATAVGATELTSSLNTGLASANIPPILDYDAIPNAYAVLPAGTKIANESAMSRNPAAANPAVPIFYDLKISQAGLLSLSYSINGGAYQQVIKSQSISASNGPLPANFLFGFAGSSGGGTNVHEILCFKAQPETTASSSAGASERQSAKLETGAQAYFAFYNPNNWVGRVTASSLSLDQYGNVVVAATANWDAECVLTGVAGSTTCPTTGVAGPTAAEAPTSRTILTWSGSAGIPFEYNSLPTALQGVIDLGDVTTASCNSSTPYAPTDRTSYLRGDRSCEINSQSIGLFRARDSVLGDIIDSSPAWVGPPDAPYTATWNDRLYPTAINVENNAGNPTYIQYTQANETRLNVVYTGANDGLLHGFRSGSYNANGTFCSSSSTCTGTVTPNDGQEVLAYMPGAVLQTIHSTSNPSIDFSGSQYGHAFYVDATPGTGDLFYGNAWHSWVVGGLGPGGAAIYALDVTNPTNFAEANAGSLVIGEWTPTTLACAGTTTANGGANCGNNLGNTYGTPEIRRLHNGDWAVIFGNGLGSTSGDAGIYIMTINPTTSTTTFYYLSTSTGSAASPNGIAFASPVDLDGDHITDYVYAGDLQGNLWRFDLTSNNPSNWAVTPGPLFKAPAGQPITTAIVAASGSPYTGMGQYLMLLFGTGEKFPLTNLNPATYATGTQTLYGVWDWNLNGWNSMSAIQYAALTTPTGLTGNSVQQANLQQQTATINAATTDVDMGSPQTVCWEGTTTCSGGASVNTAYGWYLNLPGTNEQVIYNPELVQQALTVNSIVPAANDPTSCAIPNDTGFTYVFNAMTGTAFNQVFLPPSEAANPVVNTNPAYLDANAIGMQTNATGSSFITGNSSGTMYLIYETNQTGAANSAIQSGTLGLNLPPNTTGRRINWVERR